MSPVAADLSFVIEEKEKEDPGSFGPGGAYAQAFALFNCAMAAATLFGPVLAGWLSQQYGWGTMSVALGIFAFSGAIPSVSSHIPWHLAFRAILRRLVTFQLIGSQFFLTGGWYFDKQAGQSTGNGEDEDRSSLLGRGR